MQWFYDGQIRRYVGQIVRMLSGFRYQSLDGKQTTVPVMYGDLTRQVGNIIRENSENKIPSAPRIAVYISDLAMDKTRLADSSHVSKIHIREREKVFDSAGNFVEYAPTQGSGYTVERLMPTPYKLTVKADIWSTSTDQKLQILEQILMLFNPSLELQTSDNYVDWTSISVLEITNIQFSTKTIPVGVDSDIEIASITFETPIYISPPTKVKRLGVIHDIIMNIHDQNYDIDVTEKINIGGFDIFVYYNTDTGQYNAELLDPKTALVVLKEDAAKLWQKNGAEVNWRVLLDQYAGKFRAGSTQIFLEQATGNYIVGTVALNPADETKLVINFDQDTYNTNTPILCTQTDITRTNVDAIIDPETYNPGVITGNPRYLILNNIGNNTSAWGNIIAKANDIIEWTGTQWVVAQASDEIDEIIYTTNLRTGVQYKFEDGEWTRAFEGEYQKGSWRIVL
jgi:hypothetical protein